MPDRDTLVRELWQEGKNDVQIAAAISVTPCTVYNIRKRLGLPSHQLRIDRDRLRELWQQGMTDAAMAREMHALRSSVSHVRSDMRLPVNREHVRIKDWHPYTFSRACGDRMETALTPPQCAVMRQFLSDLLHCANQRRPGEHYNISRFIQEWVGHRVSA